MSTPPTETDEPIAAPRPRDDPRPVPFPLVASVAPLLASGVLWAITQSSFALVFALLSPVIAVAGMLDGRRHARRRRRAEQARYERELQAARDQVAKRHDAERAARIERAPGAVAVLSAEHVGRWRADPERFAVVSLGTGEIPSSVRIAGAGDESGLRSDAAVLAAAPVEADAVYGIGVTGSPVLARAVARGYAIQLAAAFAPNRLHLQVASASWRWAGRLPHAARVGADGGTRLLALCDTADIGVPVPARDIPPRGAAGIDRGAAMIAVAPTPEELPPGCRIVVRVEGATSARVIAGPPDVPRGPFVPELVPEPAAAVFASDLTARANTAGFRTSAVPERLRFDELRQSPGAGLACAIGRQASGCFELDLAASGPHAVVAGTTGSGKSELLVTWVTAMASTRPPAEVAFLLVDFKGGTAFAPLAGLPHTVGVITDLAHGEAERALQSLRAELRRRERVLAEVGARDIEHAGRALGRLVIVVDEFAAMLDAFPELSPVFVDVAARGRALGIHLILCTQRATGVVRDALLANCALRMSLRVTSAADSVAVIGTDDAARLSPAVPGRCLVMTDGGVIPVQIAATCPADIQSAALRAGTGGGERPVRPWLDPLTPDVPASALETGDPDAIGIGLCDRPDEQRRHTVFYRPAEEHLLALGMRGAGKSSLIRLVAASWRGPVIEVGGDEEEAWDAIARACELVRTAPDGGASTVVTIDDVDALVERFDGEYRDVFADRVLTVLRDGPRAGVSVLCTATRMTPAVRPMLALLGTTVVLAQSGKQEHLLAGAPAELFQERARAGFGVWRGHRIQLARPDSSGGDGRTPRADPAARSTRTDEAATVMGFPSGSTTVLVSRAPGRVAAELRRGLADQVAVIDLTAAGSGMPPVAFDGGLCIEGAQAGGAVEAGGADVGAVDARTRSATVLIADPDVWQTQWSLLSRLRSRARIVFEGCSIADVRAILRSRALPPPLNRRAGRVWVSDPDGTLGRGRLPSTPSAIQVP
jgi:DNA segregation ATPase FtsK/SpoIIIE and related proteins